MSCSQVLQSSESPMPLFVGQSSVIRQLLEDATVAATSGDYPILISGPMGAGKSHLARFIHHNSPRRSRPAEVIDCGALPELDNVLFGHRKGVFTGAEQDLGGRLRNADGGTVVLDDFERLSLQQQDQLHRVVEDGVFFPLGSDRALRIDSRFIATTNKPIPDEIEAGRLKEDFVSRLSYFELRVPPLSERLEDIPALAMRLLHRHNQKLVTKGYRPAGEVELDDDCWAAIQRLPLGDNVRGLEKIIVRLLARLGPRSRIRLEDIQAITPRRADAKHWLDQPTSLRRVREAAERQHILTVCRHCDFNIREAARVLDVSPKCVYEKLKQYGIDRP